MKVGRGQSRQRITVEHLSQYAARQRATNGAVARYDLRPDVFGSAPKQGQEAA